jgi:hypothetical protein
MGKGRIFGSIALLLCIVAAAIWSGCGNSNDQGISFRSLGFFEDGDGTTGESGRCASLTFDNQVPQATEGGFEGGFLGIENNMNQGINVDHVDLSYHVNGSSLSIPNDVYALFVRLGPASGQEQNGPRTFAQIAIVSTNIFNFLNDNRSRLPQPPFELVVLATAVGTADSGDVFRTNRVTYQVSLVDGSCVPAAPTPSESTGGGA